MFFIWQRSFSGNDKNSDSKLHNTFATLCLLFSNFFSIQSFKEFDDTSITIIPTEYIFILK